MNNIAGAIRYEWRYTAFGLTSKIRGVNGPIKEAIAFKNRNEYGVAVLFDKEDEISEKFSKAFLRTEYLGVGEDRKKFLTLSTTNTDVEEPFSALCAEFIDPGSDGELRTALLDNPVAWWQQWKELLGNKNVDDRIYDVLGELWTYRFLVQKNYKPQWNGPHASTYDIDCGEEFFEVKSTIVRSKKSITLSNQFQLVPPEGTKLNLIYCQFEKAIEGMSINSLVDDLVKLGESEDDINEKLESLGYEYGKSARKHNYMLHAVTGYSIDENFPAIRSSSFVGGELPAGVESITYTISLDGIEGDVIYNGDSQNENE